MDIDGFSEIDPKHNLPPPGELDAVALRDRLDSDYSEVRDRMSDLVAAEGRLPTISTDDEAGKVSDYIKQITAACKNTDSLRVSEKEPYLQGARAVDGFFLKGIIEPLSALKRRVEAKLTDYLRRKAAKERQEREEAERKAREEEARVKREAEEKAAAAQSDEDMNAAIDAEKAANEASVDRIKAQTEAQAKPADLSRTRGDYGSVSSLRTTWDFEIVDVSAVPRQFLMVNEAAVKAHMKARAKNQPPQPVAGIRFYEKTAATVR